MGDHIRTREENNKIITKKGEVTRRNGIGEESDKEMVVAWELSQHL